jgi:hypothetical protein
VAAPDSRAHRVHEPAKVGVAAVAVLDDYEPGPDEEDVVVDVQEGDLRALLAEHHPERVEELDVLVVVVHPRHEAQPERVRPEVHLVVD